MAQSACHKLRTLLQHFFLLFCLLVFQNFSLNFLKSCNLSVDIDFKLGKSEFCSLFLLFSSMKINL